jgi:hypothetical protein
MRPGSVELTRRGAYRRHELPVCTEADMVDSDLAAKGAEGTERARHTRASDLANVERQDIVMVVLDV